MAERANTTRGKNDVGWAGRGMLSRFYKIWNEFIYHHEKVSTQTVGLVLNSEFLVQFREDEIDCLEARTGRTQNTLPQCTEES